MVLWLLESFPALTFVFTFMVFLLSKSLGPELKRGPPELTDDHVVVARQLSCLDSGLEFHTSVQCSLYSSNGCIVPATFWQPPSLAL
jgi:hypothetical protein